MHHFSLMGRVRPHWRPILVVHVFFALLGVAALTPLFGVVLRILLGFSGQAAVADQDIAMLLLTPAGLLGGIFLAALWLAIFSLELGALLAIAIAGEQDRPVRPRDAILYAIRNAPGLLRLTLELTVRVLAYVLPFLLVLWLIASGLLRDHDINYYLAQRPPEFILALVLAGLCLAALLWVLGRRMLRWSLVLPLLLFADLAPAATFAESTRLTTAHHREALSALLAWLLLSLLLSLLPPLLLQLAGGAVVTSASGNLPALVALLGAAATMWLLLNLLVSALVLGAFAFVIAGLYKRYGPPVSHVEIEQELHTNSERAGNWSSGRITFVIVLAAALAAGAGLLLVRGINIEDEVIVIAHRGAAGSAPENTIAAIRRAITDGTDWVEIDVQESRDGKVVVVHDSDFMKLAGNPLKVWDGDLAEIQQIDIGSWFGQEFSDQRPPTLAQVLDEVRGRARLVIELKYYGHDANLEQRVIDLVEAAGMESEVVLMSLNLAGVQKAKSLRPDWTVGLLAATAVGDLTRLNVDFLAVSASMARRSFIRRAHKSGKPVFVWTVNDAVSLSSWMSQGVDGVITDEPALARQVLAQRAELNTGERLILRAATWFGQSPPPGTYRDASP
jgi:glycerophosphoryl diester phosphodiesterase